MTKFQLLAAASAALFGLSSAGAQAQTAGGISITVTPWSAPNIYGSPSFDPAAANQFNALYTGAASAGTPNTPAYYQAITNPVAYGANIATNFNSWMGSANPGAGYGGELGNRVQFGLLIAGSGGQRFSISQLSLVFDGNGASNFFDYDFGTGYQYTPYGNGGGYVGILYGADGKLGGADDTFITSGASTQLVDALIGRGSGNADAVYCGVSTGAPDEPPFAGPCGSSNQSYIDDEIAVLKADGFNQLTATYSLVGTNVTGSGTVNFADAPVPEPATWALMIAGFGMIGGAMRRRQAAVRVAFG